MTKKHEMTFLQTLNEEYLRELVLIPLFSALGYNDIRSLHGALERGKDIVFCQYNPLQRSDRYYGATVKRQKLSGCVSDSMSMREVGYQLEQSLKIPFLHPIKGEIYLDHVYFITPYEIDQQAIGSICDKFKVETGKCTFIDGSSLLSLIKENCPNLLTSVPDPEMQYIQLLAQRFLTDHPLKYLIEDSLYENLFYYIEARLVATDPVKAKYISFSNPIIDEDTISMEVAFAKSKHLIILADVGGGKSTLLKRLIISHSKGETTLFSEINSIPVFVNLGHFNKEDLESYEVFCETIDKQVADHDNFKEFHIKSLKSDYTILFDGFDELPCNHDQVSEYLNHLSFVLKKGIIVTSRPSRIPKCEEHYAYLKINPFREEDIRAYLEKWFQYNLAFQERLLAKNKI